MAKVKVSHTKESPKFVEAEHVKVSKDKKRAKVEAWGHVFDYSPIKHHPSDRFESAHDSVLVQHPTGNWLRVFWWV